MYEELGVDSMKTSVRKTFGDLIDNDFPGAWCNIVRDPDYPGMVFTQHNDGDGSKFVQRILILKETGDMSVIGGAVDDALQMNLGDIAASGFVDGKIVVTDVIDINGFEVPKDGVMDEIKIRFSELKELYRRMGFNFYVLGGETADLPDQVRSIVFNMCVYARAKEKDVISGNVRPGDVIHGFASDGRAKWEKGNYNFGIGSNGLTLARVKSMWSGYTEKYSELIRRGGRYEGEYKVDQKYLELPNPNFFNISRALISPTRQWSILIRMIIREFKARGIFDKLHGISFNTGGGAAKIKHLGTGGIKYKKNMPTPSLLFQRLKELSGESWENMFTTFNCGIGIDVVGEPCEQFAGALNAVSIDSGIHQCPIGYCEESGSSENEVELSTDYGNFKY
jgi:phosphoribosylaminoimidazole (AIR) synthetase